MGKRYNVGSRMKKALWQGCVFLLIFFWNVGLAAADKMPLPQDGEVPGWSRSGKTLLFTKADLYGHIDGGAELFLEFGFEQLGVQNYLSGEKELDVEIYRMADEKAALGVYLMKCGKEERLDGFASRHSATKYQLLFCQGRYFVIINQFHSGETLPGDAKKMGEAICRAIPAAAYPDYFQDLPVPGRDPSYLRLYRGPIAFQSLYTFGEGDLFDMKESIHAVSCGYRRTDSKLYYRVSLCYDKEEKAKSILSKVSQGLDSYLTRLEEGPNRIVFRDFADEYGEILREGSCLKIRIHLTTKP